MAAPLVTDYRLKNWGANDPGGNPDYWNRYSKMLWGNFAAYTGEYGAGTGEHDRDGDHMADFLASFGKFEEGTYTGNSADDRDITLSDTSIDIKFIRVWEASTAGTWFRSESMAGDATFDTPTVVSAADYIQSVATTGQFQVGTALNVVSRVYYYAVWGV